MAKKVLKKKKKSILDFRNVDARRSRIPNDDYLFKVTDAYEGTSGSGNPTAYFEAQIVQGNHKGFKGYYNCSMKPKALWKLRQFLEALGMEDIGKKFEIDWTSLINKKFGATVEEDSYQGKVRSKIIDVFPADELEDSDEDEEQDEEVEEDEDEEEEEAPRKKKSTSDEDEEDDEDEDEEGEEEDEEEEDEEEVKPKKKKKA